LMNRNQNSTMVTTDMCTSTGTTTSMPNSGETVK
jgi:hypothetical protein